MLENLEKSHGISKIQLLREIIELEILSDLQKQPWSKKVAFYGGTALRLAYGSPRYSEDIDLICRENIAFSSFKAWMHKLPAVISSPASIDDVHEKRRTLFGLVMVRQADLKHALPIKIEIYRNVKKVKLEVEPRLLKSPLSSLSPLLFVPPARALLEMKIAALHDRTKSRDLYDLWYLSQVLKMPFLLPKKIPHFTRRDFINELQVYLPRDQYPIISFLWQTYVKASQTHQNDS